MELTFLGAAREVTGSCTLLQANGRHILIDCGMEQGVDVYENAPLPLAPGEIDAVLITHAHIDHTGRLPLLVKNGYSGPIHSTVATARLCDVMLRDSAHIQESEAEWKNRKGRRKGEPEVEPLYTVQDAQDAVDLLVPHPYGQRFAVCEGIEIRFTDVGHLLGSASIEIWVTEGAATTKLVFSGDIGNIDQPIIRDPQYLAEADYVVMESTYGDRLHPPKPDYIGELAQILQRTFDRGGNVVIPAFAVGRTQELLYFLREIKQRGLVQHHADFPVYVDSPLAIETTGIFHKSVEDCFDAEAMALVRAGVNPIAFPGLRVAVSSSESQLINTDPTPKVILSASGMCEAGRIRHHLKHNLWRKESTVLFVGYQAVGTLGRALVDGTTTVKLFGEEIAVQAEICQLTGMSGHADRNGLLKWLRAFSPRPKQVFVNHGDDAVAGLFTRDLNTMGYQATAPYNGARWQITPAGCTCLYAGNSVRLTPKERQAKRNMSAVYQRLLAAGQRLAGLLRSAEGWANKDVAKLADQITALCERWE